MYEGTLLSGKKAVFPIGHCVFEEISNGLIVHFGGAEWTIQETMKDLKYVLMQAGAK